MEGLPLELVHKILSLFSAVDLGRSSQISLWWRQHASNPRLWRDLYFRRWTCSANDLNYIKAVDNRWQSLFGRMKVYCDDMIPFEQLPIANVSRHYIEEVICSPYKGNRNSFFVGTDNSFFTRLSQLITESLGNNELVTVFAYDLNFLAKWRLTSFEPEFIKVLNEARSQRKKVLLMVNELDNTVVGVNPIIREERLTNELIRVCKQCKFVVNDQVLQLFKIFEDDGIQIRIQKILFLERKKEFAYSAIILTLFYYIDKEDIILFAFSNCVAELSDQLVKFFSEQCSWVHLNLPNKQERKQLLLTFIKDAAKDYVNLKYDFDIDEVAETTEGLERDGLFMIIYGSCKKKIGQLYLAHQQHQNDNENEVELNIEEITLHKEDVINEIKLHLYVAKWWRDNDAKLQEIKKKYADTTLIYL